MEYRGRRNEGSLGEAWDSPSILLCVCFADGQSSVFLSLLLPTDTSSDFVSIVLRTDKSLLT